MATAADLLARFRAKAFVTETGGCIEWRAALTNTGYGAFGVGRGSIVLAHRWAFELFVRPLRDGEHVHHVCENRRCVNPAHLAAMLPKQHVAVSRSHNKHKTHCRAGHAYTQENTEIRRDGRRRCRECHRQQERARGRSR